jgi:dipeptidyl aminopeptidase/acylaminoacyl peptidase
MKRDFQLKRKVVVVLTLLFLLFGILLIPFFTKDRTPPLANFDDFKLTDFKYREIEFFNNSDHTKLGGMLFLPDQKENYPLAIIIHGSGSSNRKNSWYLALTQGLLKRGTAVLMPDKRGSENSAGEWVGKTIEDLATDTESAIEFAKSQESFKFKSLGIIGISQGGWIAPVVASKSKDLDFVINISGSFTNAGEQLIFEEENNIRPYTYDFLARLIASFSIRKVKKLKSVAPLVKFDPIPYWKKVSSKSLFIYGENDSNCPVELSLNRLKEENLLKAEVKVYKDGHHGILNETKTNINHLLFRDIEQFIAKP